MNKITPKSHVNLKNTSSFGKLKLKKDISKYYREQSFRNASANTLFEIVDFVQLILISWDFPKNIEIEIGIPKHMFAGSKNISVKKYWDLMRKNLFTLNSNIIIHKMQIVDSSELMCTVCAN